MTNGIQDAAKQLEAYFVRSFLSEAKIGEGLAGKGFSGETFADMLQNALADKITDGGIGMADSLVAQLSQHAAGHSAGHGELTNLPVHGTVSSHFGHRRDPITGAHRPHHGIDVAAPLGSPVRASGAGQVAFAGQKPGYGNVVIIDHADGLQTRYAHLREVGVKTGARVSSGDSVGSVGETGRSTGPHLHFEIRRHGQPVNPTEALPALNQNRNRSNF